MAPADVELGFHGPFLQSRPIGAEKFKVGYPPLLTTLGSSSRERKSLGIEATGVRGESKSDVDMIAGVWESKRSQDNTRPCFAERAEESDSSSQIWPRSNDVQNIKSLKAEKPCRIKAPPRFVK